MLPAGIGAVVRVPAGVAEVRIFGLPCGPIFIILFITTLIPVNPYVLIEVVVFLFVDIQIVSCVEVPIPNIPLTCRVRKVLDETGLVFPGIIIQVGSQQGQNMSNLIWITDWT